MDLAWLVRDKRCLRAAYLKLAWTHPRDMAIIETTTQRASCSSRHGVVPTGRQRLYACAQHRVDDVCDGAAAAEVIDWLREALHQGADGAAAR